jgi:predicted XRE-type DNA-binding protein
MKKKSRDGVEYHEGSGNVYKDLGFENPEEWATKAGLASKILDLIEVRKLTQKEAGHLLGIAQGRVSDLKRGQFDKFSVEKLLSFLNALGHDVDIVIRPKAAEVAQITVAAPSARVPIGI